MGMKVGGRYYQSTNNASATVVIHDGTEEGLKGALETFFNDFPGTPFVQAVKVDNLDGIAAQVKQGVPAAKGYEKLNFNITRRGVRYNNPNASIEI